ncbi:MAG: hypothetical protein DHS20C21_04650 [Gemmatimonadota bacterium]|nr:MAG: hypothetical protein DHS20C21_04650 [Gemmatimonadota bacterium]
MTQKSHHEARPVALLGVYVLPHLIHQKKSKSAKRVIAASKCHLMRVSPIAQGMPTIDTPHLCIGSANDSQTDAKKGSKRTDSSHVTARSY